MTYVLIGVAVLIGLPLLKYVLLALIKLYQWTVSRMLGPVCRFYPSCSRYGYEAISTHGALKGVPLTVWRILRCNPFNSGGVDPVPPRKRRPWAVRARDRFRDRSAKRTDLPQTPRTGLPTGAHTTARGA
jgi:putative membrane protein insertion efficiency factor